MSDSIKSLSKKHNANKPVLYTDIYEEYFLAIRNKSLSILELGILKGGSLKLWAEYFPNSKVIGIDVQKVELDDDTRRIHIYQGYQQDKHFLDKVRQEVAPNGFDIIIDDASHIGLYTKQSFWHLFDNHLINGGIYAIEDWGTGYWPTWHDGARFLPYEEDVKAGELPKYFPSHQYGMVGFLKQLIDESHHDAIREGLNSPPNRQSKFEKMCIYAGLAIITKRKAMPEVFRSV